MKIIVEVVVTTEPRYISATNAARADKKRIGIDEKDIVQILPSSVGCFCLLERHQGPDILVVGTVEELVNKCNRISVLKV